MACGVIPLAPRSVVSSAAGFNVPLSESKSSAHSKWMAPGRCPSRGGAFHPFFVPSNSPTPRTSQKTTPSSSTAAFAWSREQ